MLNTADISLLVGKLGNKQIAHYFTLLHGFVVFGSFCENSFLHFIKKIGHPRTFMSAKYTFFINIVFFGGQSQYAYDFPNFSLK